MMITLARLHSLLEDRMEDIKKYYNVKEVPLHHINKASPTQNPKQVEHYREKIKTGQHIDPIQVMHDKYRIHGKARYTLTDGHHRYEAHRLEGKKTIPVAFAKPKTKKYGHGVKDWTAIHKVGN